jgi:hypothetical protein
MSPVEFRILKQRCAKRFGCRQFAGNRHVDRIALIEGPARS